MCGPFLQNIVEKSLWRSSGKFVEKLKSNMFDQLICTLEGRSDWIFYKSDER